MYCNLFYINYAAAPQIFYTGLINQLNGPFGPSDYWLIIEYNVSFVYFILFACDWRRRRRQIYPDHAETTARIHSCRNEHHNSFLHGEFTMTVRRRYIDTSTIIRSCRYRLHNTQEFFCTSIKYEYTICT